MSSRFAIFCGSKAETGNMYVLFGCMAGRKTNILGLFLETKFMARFFLVGNSEKIVAQWINGQIWRSLHAHICAVMLEIGPTTTATLKHERSPCVKYKIWIINCHQTVSHVSVRNGPRLKEFKMLN